MQSDQTLVKKFQTGDRDAFTELVGRYQNYICSIAYSWTGDMGRSEDLAQQTFLTAWEKLDQLSEPSKLLPWLRGIVKNLSRNEYRKRATDHAIRDQLQSKGVRFENRTPLMRCISREQSDILWTILEQIPELYREPLVLYYRESKSVAKVAELMDLTEDAVKQRLSRGRKLVKSEIESFVEDTLFETRPDNHFAAGIIAALPAAGSKLSGSAAVTGGATALGAKSLFLTLAGPLIGLAGAYVGSRAALNSATSEPEERFLKKVILWSSSLAVAFSLVVISTLFLAPSWLGSVWLWITLVVLYGGCLWIAIHRTNRRLVEIKRMHGTAAERSGAPALPPKAVSTNALRFNAVLSTGGTMCVVPILAMLAHDWIGLTLYLVFLAGLVSWLWRVAPQYASATAQIRFNANCLLVAAWAMAIFLLVRWDHWLLIMNYPDSISGWWMAILLAGFGSLLYGTLLSQARRIERNG